MTLCKHAWRSTNGELDSDLDCSECLIIEDWDAVIKVSFKPEYVIETSLVPD